MRQRPRLMALGLVGSLFAGALNAMGSEDSYLSDMRSAHRAGQAQVVYELALSQLEAGEGDPAFDFYYGVAAIDTDHINEGVFALERVLLVSPNHLRARLELGRGYFLLREDSRALQEFQAVLGQNPSEHARANVQRYVDAIRLREGRYRPSSSAYIETGFGHDSNVSGSADGVSIGIALGPLLSVASLSNEPDEFFYARGGGRYNKPLRPGLSAFTSVDIESRHNLHDDDFDTSYINAIGGLSLTKGADQYRLSLQAQKYHVGESNFSDFLASDEDTFRQLIGINGELRRTLSSNTQVTAFAQIADLHYPGADIRDSILLTVGAGATHVVSNGESWVKKFKPVIFGTTWLGHERSENRSDAAKSVADRQFFGVRGGMRIIPMARLSLEASATYQWSEFNEDSTVFFTSSGSAITRRDDFYLLSLGAKYLLTDSIVIGGEVSYTDTDSRNVLNDFDRTQAKAFVRYNFN